MDPNELEVGKKYVTIAEVEVCFYEDEDCASTLPIDLNPGTELVYLRPDAEDGYVFADDNGLEICLHDNDLASIRPE